MGQTFVSHSRKWSTRGAQRGARAPAFCGLAAPHPRVCSCLPFQSSRRCHLVSIPAGEEEERLTEDRCPPAADNPRKLHTRFSFHSMRKTEPRAHVQLQWSLGNVVFVPGDHTTQRKLEGSVAKENRETGSFSSMGRPCSRSVLRSVCHTISPPNLGLRSSHSTKAFWLLAIPLLKSF